jgi:NTE family protein
MLAAATSGQAPTSPATNQAPLPAVAPAGRPVIGLALEGGGALGLAHAGVLQWMEEHHIPIDRIAGTSMGALAAGFYASGLTPAQMGALATTDAFAGIFTLQLPYADISYRRRQDRHEIPDSFPVGLRHGPQLRNALLIDRGLNEFLVANMAAYNGQDLDYNRLPIPLRCVATDLNTLQAVVIDHGPLAQAVRASVSIPGVFPPVRGNDGHYLVDGGILDNLPTDVVRRDLHADIVIAIHLDTGGPVDSPDIGSVVAVLNRAFSAGISRNEDQARSLADLVVDIPLAHFANTDYSKGTQLIRAGYQAAEQNRVALLRYALDDQDWNTYLAARQGRIHSQPRVLQQVRVEGGSPDANKTALADLKPLQGKPFSAAPTFEALKPVQSNGGYSATYETFVPSTAAAPTATGTPGNSNPTATSSTGVGSTGIASTGIGSTGILVRLTKDPIGPPYLIIGPELSAATSNITRMEMNLRVVDQNFGGFGSEFRGTARLGYMTDLSAEYYRLLTRSGSFPGGFFIEPRAGIVREPVYIWSDQKRIAERFQQNLVAGLEAGRTFGNSMQVSAEWRAEDTRWALRTGTGGGPYISGTAQSGLLHINIDKASSGAVSPNGYRLAASAGALYHAVGSSNAPIAQFSFSRSFSFNPNNMLGMGADVNSYLRANVAQPFRFTLGGPMRLSASSFDEYRGTDTSLARAGYMHRIAALPTGLGQGLYGLIGYEAGEVWSPEQRAFLRQDGSAGLVGNTPIGLVTFGVSIGDAGHRKVFLTVGRWF